MNGERKLKAGQAPRRGFHSIFDVAHQLDMLKLLMLFGTVDGGSHAM
jgi:hypothetical protein